MKWGVFMVGRDEKVVSIKVWKYKKKFSFLFKFIDNIKSIFTNKKSEKKTHPNMKRPANN